MSTATLALVFVSGCGQPIDDNKPNHEHTVGANAFDDVADSDGKSDSPAVTGGSRSVGAISDGQTKMFYHSGSPNFRSLYFDAKVGDSVTIDVSAGSDDAETWLIDASNKTVGYNDDKSQSTYDSEIKVKLPATGRYRIMMQEYDHYATTFTATLKLKAASATTPPTTTPPVNYFACSKDSDCVAIANPACCESWAHVAVAKSKESAYVTAASCQQAAPQCAPPPSPNSDTGRAEASKVAECDQSTKACVMIVPDDITCGGSASTAHACPSPWTCLSSGQCQVSCTYGSTSYFPGDTWKTADGCNDCSCADNGVSTCTSKACPVCDYTTTTTKRYVARSVASCATSFFLCKVGEHRFDDTCGCGCAK